MTDNRLKPLRLAFVGGGCNSAVGYAHYCASQLDGYWQLVAGAFSRDRSINLQTGQRYGIKAENVFSDWQKLLEHQHLYDAIVVLTPTPSHETIICKALQRNITVICEKSLSHTLKSALKIAECQAQTQSPLLVTYNYSAYPMVREVRDRIQSGQLGEIQHIQIEMPQEGFARLLEDGKKPNPQAWRLHDGEIPTLHLDLTTHLHHLIYYMTGDRPLSVMANHNQFGWFNGVIDDATAVVTYQSGMQANYWASKSALGYKNGLKFRIMGSNASVHWLQARPEYLSISYVDGRCEIIERGSPGFVINQPEYNRFKAGHPAGFIEGFANLYRDFALAINNVSEASSTWQDYGINPALEGLSLMSAMTQSHRNQQWVNVINQNAVTDKDNSAKKNRDKSDVVGL